MEPITSTSNPRVREVASLSRRRIRRERGEHLVEGPHAVAEALKAGVVTQRYATVGARGTTPSGDGPLATVTDHVLSRMADAVTPQGIVAVARTVTTSIDAVVGEGLLVILHRVADPGNAGAILRTADAAGAAGVVFTAGSVDPFSPKSIRAAAGSTYHLPIVVDAELREVAAAVKLSGQRLLALDGAGEVSVFTLMTSGQPSALVLGNEAHGLDDEVRSMADAVVAVPIHGRSESLNVAAAAAVAMYAVAEGMHRTG